MKRFFLSWVFYAIAVLAAGCVIKGIHYEKPLDLFMAALLIGILNAVLRPVLIALAMPLLRKAARFEALARGQIIIAELNRAKRGPKESQIREPVYLNH